MGAFHGGENMGYVILRTQKLKHVVSVRRSMMHALRSQQTPNADPARTKHNTASADTVTDVLDSFNARLATQTKIRKNAVLAIEYLVTGSPVELRGKSRAEQDAYFADALAWLKAKHGAENIVAHGVHRDETTPHMYAVVVPIDKNGKLNCRAFLGGASALHEMQSDFASKVGAKHKLERGVEGSKAKHVDIQRYYARVNASQNGSLVKVPEPTLMERLNPMAYGRRVAASVAKQADFKTLKAKATERDAAMMQAQTDAQRAATASADAVKQKARAEAAEALAGLFTADEIQRAKDRRDEIERRQKEIAEQEYQAEQRLIEQATIDQERQRRVNNLAEFARSAGGALATFAAKAKSAIAAVAGDWRRVDWRGVEQESLRESITRNKQEPAMAIADVLSHSPGVVTPAELEARKRELDATVGRLRPSAGPKNSNDYGMKP